MAIPFLNHLDLRSVAELQNAILHKTTSATASNVEGKIIYDTGTNSLKYYNGTAWVNLDGSGDIAGVTAGAGLIGGGTSGNVTLNIGDGAGITVNANDIEANVDDVTIQIVSDEIAAKTAAVSSGSAALATGGQIYSFVNGSYVALTDTLTFSGGDVTGSGAANSNINLTIGSSVIEAGMLNNNIISGQTALTGGLLSTDEFLISDGGTIKRMDVSVLQSYMQSNLTFTTNTTYDLGVNASGTNDSIIRLTGSDGTNDDVTISGTGTTIKVTESGNTITLDLQDDVTIANDLTVTGDLVVSGTTTTVNTETINLADNIITLNSNYTGSTPSEHGGIEIERGTLANSVLRWNETSDRWEFTNDGGTTYYNIPIPTEYDNYSSWTIKGDAATTYTVTSGDTLQIEGGNGINSVFTADDVLTISHADTSSQTSVNNSGRTYIQDITLDAYGHITGITSATETVVNTQLATASALIDVSAMGTNTVASFTHSLASKNLIVQMYDVTTGEVVFADIDHTSNNAISIIFAATPTNDIRVVVIDAKNGLTDKTVSYS